MGEAPAKQPGNRPPAPAPLDVVQAFVNSWDREGGVEAFASPDALARWLARHGLLEPGHEVTGRDVRETIELREAIRALLFEHNGGAGDPRARATFARCGGRAVLAARLDAAGMVELAPARGGIGAAWARILAAIAEASAAGTWPRLKACRAETCRWAFYDRSRTRSSQWCTMELCGARDKMRRYRSARRA